MISPTPARDSRQNAPTGIDLVTFAFDVQREYDQNKALYIDAQQPSRSLNAIQFKVLVRKIVAGLKASGLQKGERVVLHLFNSFLYSALYFGIIGAGGICVGSNPAYRTFDLDHLLKLAEPVIIISSPDLISNVLETLASKQIANPNLYVLDASRLDISWHAGPSPSTVNGHAVNVQNGSNTPYHSFEDLLAHGEEDWIRILDEQTAKATPAAYFQTSGTSGAPKEAVLSHYALIAQHESVNHITPFEVVRLLTVPYFHVFGALFGHIFPIRYGEPMYVMPRFHLGTFVKAIDELKITNTFMAPPMLYALNGSDLPLKDLLKSLRYVVCGGERMVAASQKECYKYLSPEAVVTQAWGMTEIGAVTIFSWPERDLSGSVGRIVEGTEIKLVDFEGRVVGKDSQQSGLAYVRTGNLMSGYRSLNLIQEPLTDDKGWFCTGDVVSAKDGKFYVTGREKELIKVKAWQVAPAELEAVLRKHPAVADVAVVGVLRDDGVSEVPRAYIVRDSEVVARGPTGVTAEEVYSFARERLASYKALDGGIVFVDSIPRTASGKIQKFKLKELFRTEEALASTQPATNGDSNGTGGFTDKRPRPKKSGRVGGLKRDEDKNLEPSRTLKRGRGDDYQTATKKKRRRESSGERH